MYEELIEKLEERLSIDEMKNIKKSNLHLGIFTEPYLTYMLNGEKKIESRFSKNKIAPYNKINKSDIVIVKKSGGSIVAYFTIKEVLFFDLSETLINDIKNKYEKELCVNNEFWNVKQNSRYATLIKIDKIHKIKPFSILKKGMQTWICLK